jgi:hypothetical protein
VGRPPARSMAALAPLLHHIHHHQLPQCTQVCQT